MSKIPRFLIFELIVVALGTVVLWELSRRHISAPSAAIMLAIITVAPSILFGFTLPRGSRCGVILFHVMLVWWILGLIPLVAHLVSRDIGWGIANTNAGTTSVLVGLVPKRSFSQIGAGFLLLSYGVMNFHVPELFPIFMLLGLVCLFIGIKQNHAQRSQR